MAPWLSCPCGTASCALAVRSEAGLHDQVDGKHCHDHHLLNSMKRGSLLDWLRLLRAERPEHVSCQRGRQPLDAGRVHKIEEMCYFEEQGQLFLCVCLPSRRPMSVHDGSMQRTESVSEWASSAEVISVQPQHMKWMRGCSTTFAWNCD